MLLEKSLEVIGASDLGIYTQGPGVRLPFFIEYLTQRSSGLVDGFTQPFVFIRAIDEPGHTQWTGIFDSGGKMADLMQERKNDLMLRLIEVNDGNGWFGILAAGK